MDDLFAQMLRPHPGDTVGRMLRAPALRTAGGCYAFTVGADLMVKLPADRVAALVAAGAGLPCAPRPDRPMREWVRIPSPDPAAALSYAVEARTFVAAT